MSTMSEPLQSKPMWISLSLNAALSLGIVLLLTTAQAQTSNLGRCGGTSTVMTTAEIAQAGKVRYKAIAEVEQPVNVMRNSASSATAGTTLPIVSYIRCRSN